MQLKVLFVLRWGKKLTVIASSSHPASSGELFAHIFTLPGAILVFGGHPGVKQVSL